MRKTDNYLRKHDNLNRPMHSPARESVQIIVSIAFKTKKLSVAESFFMSGKNSSLFLVVENLTVVVRILNALLQIPEELNCVNQTADHEPDGRDDADDTRDQQRGDEELHRPPGVRSRPDRIPDHDTEEGSSREFVGKSVRDTSEPAVSQAAIRHNRSPAGRFYSVCRLTAART